MSEQGSDVFGLFFFFLLHFVVQNVKSVSRKGRTSVQKNGIFMFKFVNHLKFESKWLKLEDCGFVAGQRTTINECVMLTFHYNIEFGHSFVRK